MSGRRFLHTVYSIISIGLLLIFLQCDYLVYPKKEKEPVWHIYFNKSVDNAYSNGTEITGNVRIDLKLSDRILAAESSIDFCFYNIESDTIISTLIKAYNNQIRVRVITDDKYLDKVTLLVLLGIPVISDSAGGIYISKDMHNKFAIFDKEWVWTGSYNATENGTFGNANNVIEFNSAEIATAFTIEFEEMWGSPINLPNEELAKFHTQKSDNINHLFELDGYPIEIYMSPSDLTKDAILSAIATADYEIYFCIFSFTDDSISAAMEMQLSDFPGLTIMGVFDETQAGSQYSEFHKMETWGDRVVVRVDAVTDTAGTEKFLHHKYLLIDAEHPDSDPVLITGSTNWSNNGFSYNDENLIVSYHPDMVNSYLQEFMARFEEGE